MYPRTSAATLPQTPSSASRSGRRVVAVVVLAAALSTTAACGDSSTGASTAGTTVSAPIATIASATSSRVPAAGLTVADAWAKAVPDLSSSQMTGVFAALTNTTDTPIVVVSATNDRSATTELHETVMKDGAMVMQPVTGGFTIASHQTRQLKPGGDHIMLMKLAAPLKVGDQVKLVLKTDGGATIPLTAVAKAFTMGNEPYASASTHS